MARLARIVLPDVPHHVTQRGNRRMAIFSERADYGLCRDLIAELLKAHGVVCSAYCLMPNHVHLLLTPTLPDAAASLSRAVGEAHRRFTAFVNARARTTGHLFQGRFGSVAMDEAHWLAAVRYLALNPVRAGLVDRPQDWPWCSVKAHLRGRGDGLVDVSSVLAVAPRFADLIAAGADDPPPTEIANGRPLGDAAFMARAEALLGRSLTPRRPGRKPAATQ
ncbi:MAG TPA: transposase [Roseiarcus sp.]|nr:transposase [Roseiarcus sp.]